MELRDYWRAVRQRWRIVLVGVMLSVLAASVLTIMTPRSYEARTDLFVAPEAGGTTAELAQGSSFVLDRVKSYVQVIDKEVVLQPVIEELGLTETVADLAERVTATVVTDTVVVRVRVTDPDPERAAVIANEIAETFIGISPSLEPMRADETAVVRITVIESARAPETPVSPRPQLNLALALMFGLALGLAGAVARETLDRRVKGERDMPGLTEAPIIGHVPVDRTAESEPVARVSSGRGLRGEAMRKLRTNLQFFDVAGGRRSYVITSSLPGEGKSITAVNLALALAEGGQKVCFVEADLRRPNAGRYMGLEDAVGLTDSLIGNVEVEDVIQPWQSGLDVLLAGAIPPNPADLLSSSAMEDLMRNLEGRYDVVIVDAPPLLPVSDAAILAKLCAGAIMVVGLGRRSVAKAELARAIGMLTTLDAKILGIVLNKVPLRGPNAVPALVYTYHPEPERQARRRAS